ncbi:MAG: SPOR domain-containing protein [Candidatus Korobacteraceae bacterium]
MQRLMAESDEREITLGVGKLVGLFFLLVTCCAVCFALGYGFGRSGAKQPALATEVQAAAAKPEVKPVAKQQPDAPVRADCATGEDCQKTGIPAAPDLSFYKAVEQKDAHARLTPPQPAQTPQPAKPAQPAPSKAIAPENSSAIASGIMVQVAAVSKREDAEVLQDALRRKQYPVLITSTPSDKLFHIQIGPFSDPKEAETTRSRLQGDGYNSILKR